LLASASHAQIKLTGRADLHDLLRVQPWRPHTPLISHHALPAVTGNRKYVFCRPSSLIEYTICGNDCRQAR